MDIIADFKKLMFLINTKADSYEANTYQVPICIQKGRIDSS